MHSVEPAWNFWDSYRSIYSYRKHVKWYYSFWSNHLIIDQVNITFCNIWFTDYQQTILFKLIQNLDSSSNKLEKFNQTVISGENVSMVKVHGNIHMYFSSHTGNGVSLKHYSCYYNIYYFFYRLDVYFRKDSNWWITMLCLESCITLCWKKKHNFRQLGITNTYFFDRYKMFVMNFIDLIKC